MGATFLELVNRVRGSLRHSRVTTAQGTDRLTIEVADLVHEAAATILEERTWHFDRRYDGLVHIPGEFTGSQAAGTGAIFQRGAAQVALIDPDSANTIADLTTNDLVWWLVCTNDDRHPETAYRVRLVQDGPGTLTLTLASVYRGSSTSVPNGISTDWRLFAFGHVLPATVREILRVRSEELPLPLEVIDRDTVFDDVIPRPHEVTHDWPDAAMVGGTAEATADQDGSAGRIGHALWIWPPPSEDLLLPYSYVIT